MAKLVRQNDSATVQQGDTATGETGKLIKMIRQEGVPKTADVHPDEVENYKLGGWTVDKAEG